MKKAFLLLIPLVIGLVSCDKSIANIETVNELKALLDKQDLSEFHSKSLATTFTQEYDVLDVYYDLASEEYDSIVDGNGNVNVFDAIKEGEGGYRITQLAKASSFFRDGGEYSSMRNLNINQQMTLKTTDEDVLREYQ